uniref:F-actin-capping protein subunit beta n=1 Tax=Lepisosteus oculatus TaxID=7918 RepID=W5MLC2_LEPOC
LLCVCPLQSDQQLDCALDLMRRLPPQQIEKNLSDLIDLKQGVCAEREALTCGVSVCEGWGEEAIPCEPPSDSWEFASPPLFPCDFSLFAVPSHWLGGALSFSQPVSLCRTLMYFEGGVSSVYLWDLDHGFAGVILIKKAGDGSKKIKGCWDSIHVVEVQEKSSGRTAHYKLTSTVMLWLQTTKTGSGTMNLGGSLTRQMEKDETVSESSPHIANIGRLVEDMENKIRSTLNEIYFGKTKDIVNGLRSVQTLADKSKQEALKNDLMEALKRKQQS